MGAGARLPAHPALARRGRARSAGGRQHHAQPVLSSRIRRARRASAGGGRHAPIDPVARNHRGGADPGRPRLRHPAGRLPRARTAPDARRLRYRQCVAQQPQALSVRRHQDRRRVRAQCRYRQRRRRHVPQHHRDGPPSGHAGRCRGRGNGKPVRVPAPQYVRPDPGLSAGSPGAARTDGCAAGRAACAAAASAADAQAAAAPVAGR